ncbi:MAG: hypothetical protein K6E50_13340 [Lachnospiraceae bacterium]|nr:hypothetical protein [Lachnospiraceae bacterium]
MSEMVKCPSCGAAFEAKLVRCPYCKTAYDPAAEEEFMEKLEDVRTELASHKNDAGKAAGKALSKTVVLFAAAVVLILLLGFLLFALPALGDRKQKQDRKEEFRQKITESMPAEEGQGAESSQP